jgi:hypothetical protein
MSPQKVYLDESGNPITKPKVYLDDNGNPIQASSSTSTQSSSLWGSLTGALQNIPKHSALAQAMPNLPTLPSVGTATSISRPESTLHQLGRVTIGSLPAIGATLGGALMMPTVPVTGPLGPVAGAAGGAGIGESARQLVSRWFPDLARAPKSNRESLAEVTTQVALGGLTEAGGPYVDKLFKWMAIPLRNSATRSLRAVMNPTGSRAEGEALRASERLLDQGGYIAATRGQLEKRAETKVAELGAQIQREEGLVAADPRDLQEVRDALTKYADSLYMPPNPTQGGALTQTPRLGAEPKLSEIDRVQELLNTQEIGGQVSRESLRMIKQDLDELVSATGGFAKDARIQAGATDPVLAMKTKTQKQMGDRLRDILNSDKPDIAQLNSEFSTWRSVKSAMSPTSFKEEFTKPVSVWQRLWHDRYAAWLVGAGASGYSMAGGAGAAEAVGALIVVGQVMQSTIWRTVSAQQKNTLARMLANEEFESAVKLATRIAVQSNLAPAPPQLPTK